MPGNFLELLFVVFYYFIIAILLVIFVGQLFLSFPRRVKKIYSGSPSLETLIILPCRGIDFTFDENLKSLKNQSYKHYKLIAVVDSDDDLALEYIKNNRIDYILSDYNSSGSGKVRAIATALRDFHDYEAYVIADSDVKADMTWLEELLKPLTEDTYGIATTFPYFEPRGGFWSRFKTAWGFVGTGMMQSELTVFGWGGSLAFKKDLIGSEELEKFSQSISDDMALTDICRMKGKRVAFVPESVATINSPDSWETFSEWSIRQTSLLLSKTKKAFTIGILLYGSEALLMIGALLLSILVSPYFIILFLPLILNEIKMFKRLRRKEPIFILIQIILPFFYVWNLVKGSRNRTIAWRGNIYDLYER
ncbi:MAG: glycosyltransferase family 2 protein [Cuniculiplasma sp.]